MPCSKALADDETVTNSDDVIAGVVANPQAAASVLIEAHTGEIIFGVNEDSALPPASTTKILTALFGFRYAGRLG